MQPMSEGHLPQTSKLREQLPTDLFEAIQQDRAKFLLKKRVSTINRAYAQFQRKYRNDRVAFVHDIFKWREGSGPTKYQEEILGLFDSGIRRVAVRGPHAIGKSTSEAWMLLHFALTKDGADWKAPTTASVWRQLTKYLWPEIHKWARMIEWRKVGRNPFDHRLELQIQTLKLATGEAFAVASNDHTAIEGAHADYILYGFDEAKSIIDATWDAAEGALAGAGENSSLEALAFAISTPGEPLGRFYEISTHKPGFEDWTTRHVTVEEAIAAGRIDDEWVAQRRLQWGENSALFKNRVLGEFASGDADGVIPFPWVEAAMQRHDEWLDSFKAGTDARLEPNGLGVDIGLGGENSDNTIEALARDLLVLELREFPRGDVDTATMQEAGRSAALLRRYKELQGFFDVIGIGAGVVHRLKEQDDIKRRVNAFNASEKTSRLDANKEMGFLNKRAAGWWMLREMLDPNSPVKVLLPRNDKLIGELTAPRFTVRSGGVIQVESKEDIRKRLGRSTDYADATIMVLTGPQLAQSPHTRIYVVGQGYIDDES